MHFSKIRMNIVHSECLHYVICPRRLNKEIKVLCNTKVQPFMIWLNGEGFWELNFRYWLLNNLFTSLHTSVNFTHCGFHSFPPWQVEWKFKIRYCIFICTLHGCFPLNKQVLLAVIQTYKWKKTLVIQFRQHRRMTYISEYILRQST